MVRFVAAVCAMFAVGLLALGCGGTAAPEDVAEDFYAALADGDAAAFCETLSESAAQAAADDEDAESCEEGVEKSFSSGDAEDAIAQTEGVELGEAEIDGDTAIVPTTSAEGQEGETPMVKENDEWKVDIGE